MQRILPISAGWPQDQAMHAGQPGGPGHSQPWDGTHSVLPTVQEPHLPLQVGTVLPTVQEHHLPLQVWSVLPTVQEPHLPLQAWTVLPAVQEPHLPLQVVLYLQYKNLTYLCKYCSNCKRLFLKNSLLFRSGANPGFHEGVADIISLAVGTATYFQRLGTATVDP